MLWFLRQFKQAKASGSEDTRFSLGKHPNLGGRVGHGGHFHRPPAARQAVLGIRKESEPTAENAGVAERAQVDGT